MGRELTIRNGVPVDADVVDADQDGSDGEDDVGAEGG